jgi:hypothetical protein
VEIFEVFKDSGTEEMKSLNLLGLHEHTVQGEIKQPR